MEVNQVKIGNYSVGNAQYGTEGKKGKEGKENEIGAALDNHEAFNEEDWFSAMDVVGKQTFAFVSKSKDMAADEIDVAKYVNDEQANNIEAMMAEFDSGVNQVADILDSEFPGMFSLDQKNALAAQIFAQG